VNIIFFIVTILADLKTFFYKNNKYDSQKKESLFLAIKYLIFFE